MNPTNDVLEKRIAALEGGLACLTVSSGQTASLFSVLNVAQAGDNIVYSNSSHPSPVPPPYLLCFLAHLAHVFLTLHYAYWRHDMDPTDPKAAARMLVRVYRITGIPTAEMIANNESMGFDPAKRWTNEFYLRDNGMPINFATLTLSFFAISAGFHFWALIAGGFERL